MITFKISKEGANNEKVLWLVFSNKNGSSAMLNLNNIANEKGAVTGKAMKKAISNYFKGENNG